MVRRRRFAVSVRNRKYEVFFPRDMFVFVTSSNMYDEVIFADHDRQKYSPISLEKNTTYFWKQALSRCARSLPAHAPKRSSKKFLFSLDTH